MLNSVSTRCSQATTAPMAACQSPRSRTSIVNTVPMQCSTCTVRGTDVAGTSGAGMAMSQSCLVQCALQRGDVALRGIGGAGDHVDLRAAGGDRLLVQGRDGVGVDLLVAWVVF